MGNSGGAATHSGVDFQQRIAALIMTHMLCGLDFQLFGEAGGAEITELRFETADEIDDLVIVAPGVRHFVQAKNTLNVSSDPASEFGSVLAQFVGQYLTDNRPGDVYVLATSLEASGRIRKELRKVAEAVRFNAAANENMPLTTQERDVLKKAQEIIRFHYHDRTCADISDVELQRIMARIHVSVLDIREGGSLEAAALLTLSSKALVPARLLWASMIALAVSLARDRLSIDAAGIQSRFGKYLSALDQAQPAPFSSLLTAELVAGMPFGWDVVLAKSPYDRCDFIIADIKRFDEAGAKCIRFSSGHVEIGGSERWEVVGRWATWMGLERYLDTHADKYKDKELAVMAANLLQDPNRSAAALAHAAYCANLVAGHGEGLFVCRHCGNPISEDGAPLVEVDEEGQPEDVGLVHRACCTPTDRVLGGIDAAFFRDHHRLRNFDYNGWISALQGGQWFFGGLAESNVNKGFISWKYSYDGFSLGGWCIKIMREDGGTTYVRDRGRVRRLSEEKAVQAATDMNRMLAEGREKGDPFCYTASGSGWGTYSFLLAQGQEPIPCASAEAVQYTRAIGEAYSECERFYAPLAYLVDAKTGDPVVVEDVLSLLTNPLELDSYIQNWERAGIELPDFTVSAILTDEQFDRFIWLAITRGQSVIINPKLALDGSLVSGFPVTNFEETVHHAEQARDAGGDAV